LAELLEVKQEWKRKVEHLSERELKYENGLGKKQKGVFYWIGTNGETAPSWTNPSTLVGAGSISLTCSGLGSMSNPISDLLQREGGYVLLRPIDQGEWVMIDLGANRLLRPNCYTLQNPSKGKSGWLMSLQGLDALRNWRLEASLDAKTWIVLQTHTNDTSLGHGTTLMRGLCLPTKSFDSFALCRPLKTRSTENMSNWDPSSSLENLSLSSDLPGTHCAWGLRTLTSGDMASKTFHPTFDPINFRFQSTFSF